MPNLASKTLCTGCASCVSSCARQCIQMRENFAGFLYPEINEKFKCINCGACEKACPVILKEKDRKDSLPLAYAAYSKCDSLREESSSGGIFSELARNVLLQDGVIFGAAYDENFVVKHIYVETEQELSKLRGAKYAQSDLGNSFIEISKKLKNNQKVLFSGTPCQVAGLKSFLRKDYQNLICVDFVCHGVPSPMAWNEYVKYRSKIDAFGQLPEKINLRSKLSGWSRYRYSNLYEYPDGSTYMALSGNDMYMKLFVGDYISRESCSDCQFKGYSRVSDITLGDFWGIWDIDPEMDDNKGTSLILIQSEKGEKIFSEISDRVYSKEVTLQQTSIQNPSLLESALAKTNRKEVLDMINSGKIGEVGKLFCKESNERISIVRRVEHKIKFWKTKK